MSMQDLADGFRAGAEMRRDRIQALLDRMFTETLERDPEGPTKGCWSVDEWRKAVTEASEDVPALKDVLHNARADWRNDDWFAAVVRKRDLVG